MITAIASELFERLSTEKVAGQFVPGTDVARVSSRNREYEEIHGQTADEDEQDEQVLLARGLFESLRGGDDHRVLVVVRV